MHTHKHIRKSAHRYTHTHTHTEICYIFGERQRDFTLSPQTKPIKSNTHGRRICCRCRRLWLRLSLLPFVSLPLIAAAIGAIVCPQRPNKRSLAKKPQAKEQKQTKNQSSSSRRSNSNSDVSAESTVRSADPADRVQSSSRAAEQLTSTANCDCGCGSDALTLALCAVPYCSSLAQTEQSKNKANALLNTHTHTHARTRS